MGNLEAGSSPGPFYIDYALKAQQWERAKGELRALVALQGSYASINEDMAEKNDRLNTAVEMFIQRIEEDGLQE
jgi:hypothetical protein